MAARFVILACTALTLAACQTATTEDTSVRRGASPTFGSLQRTQIRGPVVADTDVAPARARHASAAPRSAAARSATRRASVVPNPMRSPKVHATAQNGSFAGDASETLSRQTELAHRAAVAGDTSTQAQTTTRAAPTVPATDAAAQMSMQTELAHQAAEADSAGETAPAPAPDPSTAVDAATRMSMQTELVHQAAATQAIDAPISETPHTTPPIDIGLGDITIDKIEKMFGGMPFLLIASIAAALVAALGFALRSSPKSKGDEEYSGPHLVENEDYREPYAA